MIRTYSVKKTFPWHGNITDKVISVMKMFGLDLETLNTNAMTHKCNIKLKTGDICFITGASGAGKSVLLREIYDLAKPCEKLNLNEIEVETGKALIDCIEGGLFESLKILSKAALSDVFCILNEPARLSDGQKYRYRLARALMSDKRMIFADEFCSNLDRITAAVISHNIHKIAKQSGKIFILAAGNDDILADLLPDVIIIKHLTGKTETIYRNK